MNKKLFAVLIALMSLSLLGIIFVQGYWINNSYQTKEDQFTFNVRQTLISVATQIQLREIQDYYEVYSGLADSIDVPDNVSFSELIYTTTNEKDNSQYIFHLRVHPTIFIPYHFKIAPQEILVILNFRIFQRIQCQVNSGYWCFELVRHIIDKVGFDL